MSESNTFTYDMAKSLKASGAKLTAEQLGAAIQDTKAKIAAHATELGLKAIATGEASGKLHANVKCSPFPVEDEQKAVEALGKETHGAFATIGDEIRHLSKLVSWLTRLNSGLSMEP